MTEELNQGREPESQRPLRLAATGHHLPQMSQEPTSPSASVTHSHGRSLEAGHLLDYLRVLHKRRWTAATAFLVVLVATMLYMFTATPIYETRTRLLIESDNPNVVSFKEVIDEQGTKADYYQTQYNILQSRALARRTLDGLNLWQNPHFGGPADRPGLIARLLGAVASSSGTGPHGATRDETLEQSRAIDRFLSNLTVAPIRNSRLVDLKYRLPDPELATRVVNALAKNYIEQNLEYKFVASKEASDWLGERLGEHRKEVEQSEVALQKYREQNDAIPLQHRENIVMQKLADLSAAVTQAKAERLQKHALYNQLESLRKQQGRTGHLSRDSVQHVHPAAESGARTTAEPVLAAVGKARRAASGDAQGAFGDPTRPGEIGRRGRQGRAVDSQRIPRLAGEGEQPDWRAEPAESRSAGDEPQSHRRRGARAGRAEQQADLREPAAARQGDRREH